MAKIAYNICVVTVTYGDRWEFLEQVIKEVLTLDRVANLIVVDNASAYNVEAKCREMRDARIKVITQQQNKGSAGGYKIGLEYFENQTQADFVWLLDDDNLPNEDALTKLMDEWHSISGEEDTIALFSLRTDRKQHINIARGVDSRRYYLIPNGFMGFNLFRIPLNQFLKIRDKFIRLKPFKRKAIMPYVPYGGLFFHKKMISKIGYPNERFFLYADDSEYTYRITERGGTIWLIPGSKITDIDRSIGTKYKHRFWKSIFLDLWSFRTYYQVRNSVFFYSRITVSNKITYNINKCLYLYIQYLISLLSSKQENYKKLLKAVNDGLSGNLGLADPEDLKS
ncbi:GT2 family glycosyltransferase [Arcticibacter tournemirensis]|uniref:Glycosyltransferase n=1 Tax=Arcticibacter tournemirensis TaxID=699437 RepID=A0A5M9H8Y5_9SPHI|nr:glycosyltransferase [Arcticibacter tournemirensis]KAA8481648.1 glycosyltransferase [Arcticibacter tournemirensis]TQM48955.1 GT2 family glycosyltransferase [Arcticibacter tournemirensis]